MGGEHTRAVAEQQQKRRDVARLDLGSSAIDHVIVGCCRVNGRPVNNFHAADIPFEGDDESAPTPGGCRAGRSETGD